MEASILAWSAWPGPIWRGMKSEWGSSSRNINQPKQSRFAAKDWKKGLAGVDEGFVASAVQQLVGVGCIDGLDLEDPGVKSSFVDQVGLVVQGFVKSHDLAVDRCVDVGCGLDRFDYAGGLARFQAGTRIDIAYEHQVAQLVLRCVGDAHKQHIAFSLDPLVRGRIFAVGWKIHD